MSAGVIFTIRCDHTTDNGEAACDQEWFAPVSVTGHRDLRRHLKNCGWSRTRTADFCPDHATRPAREAARRTGVPRATGDLSREHPGHSERVVRAQEGTLT